MRHTPDIPERRAPGQHSTAIALLVLAALASALSCKRTRRTPDDTIVVLIPNLIRDMDPRFALTNYDVKLSRLVAVGLTTVDRQNLEPTLALAESIEQAGELTYRVVLRKDARFPTGQPVTAEDVRFTYESVLSDSLGSLYRRSFAERFERFEVVSEREVLIHLKKPVATLMSDLDFGIISADAADSEGKYPGGVVVGAGPYHIRSVSGDRAELERNPHYYGEAPPSPRLTVRVVRDSNARTLMLVGGSADFTQNSIRVDVVDHVVARDRIKLVAGPSAILTYVMMQNEDEILDDVRVRQAIAHAIDRERIIDAKLGGRAVLATGLLPPSHWAYNGDVETYDYDPERARQLLDAAGFPDPDGPGGEPRMRVSYKTSADQFRLTLARIIAAQLGEVGIEVDVRSFEFGTFFADIKRGNFQIASMQTADITEPDFYYTYFHSERIPTPEELNLHNRWRYRDDRLDELTVAGRREMDREKRVVLYGEVQQILARELPIIPLWHEDNLALMNVDVSDYVIYPNARFAGLARATKSNDKSK